MAGTSADAGAFSKTQEKNPQTTNLYSKKNRLERQNPIVFRMKPYFLGSGIHQQGRESLSIFTRNIINALLEFSSHQRE